MLSFQLVCASSTDQGGNNNNIISNGIGPGVNGRTGLFRIIAVELSGPTHWIAIQHCHFWHYIVELDTIGTGRV